MEVFERRKNEIQEKESSLCKIETSTCQGGGVIIRTNVPPLTFQNDSPPPSLSLLCMLLQFFFRFVVFWSNIFFYQSLKIVEIVCVMINPKTKFP